MTLKLIIFTIASTLFLQANAQEFYLRVGGGYSTESAKSEFNDADPNGITEIMQSTDISVNSNGVPTVKSLNGSLGAGFKGNVTAGYMFNEHIGAELGINYFHGKETLIGRLSTPYIESEAKAYIRGVDLSPAVLITPGFEGINPYGRIGLLITAAGKLNIESTAYQYDEIAAGVDASIAADAEVMGKFSVGYVAAFGALFPVSDRFSIFGEFEFKSFTIKSKEAEITSFTVDAVTNGQSTPVQTVADLPVSEKKFLFEEEFTVDPTRTSDQPTIIPSQEVNASGAGINLGIRLSF